MATTEVKDTKAGPKPKKSVALSGVVAGNTALCTVGRSGNDLHYRGYDILDIAETCEFEEIAHLLVHGKLPNKAELQRLQSKAARPARPARRTAKRTGSAARRQPSHGCHAHRACRCWAACCPRKTTTTPPMRATSRIA